LTVGIILHAATVSASQADEVVDLDATKARRHSGSGALSVVLRDGKVQSAAGGGQFAYAFDRLVTVNAVEGTARDWKDPHSWQPPRVRIAGQQIDLTITDITDPHHVVVQRSHTDIVVGPFAATGLIAHGPREGGSYSVSVPVAFPSYGGYVMHVDIQVNLWLRVVIPANTEIRCVDTMGAQAASDLQIDGTLHVQNASLQARNVRVSGALELESAQEFRVGSSLDRRGYPLLPEGMLVAPGGRVHLRHGSIGFDPVTADAVVPFDNQGTMVLDNGVFLARSSVDFPLPVAITNEGQIVATSGNVTIAAKQLRNAGEIVGRGATSVQFGGTIDQRSAAGQFTAGTSLFAFSGRIKVAGDHLRLGPGRYALRGSVTAEPSTEFGRGWDPAASVYTDTTLAYSGNVVIDALPGVFAIRRLRLIGTGTFENRGALAPAYTGYRDGAIPALIAVNPVGPHFASTLFVEASGGILNSGTIGTAERPMDIITRPGVEFHNRGSLHIQSGWFDGPLLQESGVITVANRIGLTRATFLGGRIEGKSFAVFSRSPTGVEFKAGPDLQFAAERLDEYSSTSASSYEVPDTSPASPRGDYRFDDSQLIVVPATKTTDPRRVFTFQPNSAFTGTVHLQPNAAYAAVQYGQHTLDLMSSAPTIEVGIDANQDGKIEFSSEGSSDVTTRERPFCFWVNDDVDRYHQDPGYSELEFDDIDPTEIASQGWKSDWTYDQITSLRDLEDFSRLWISVHGIIDPVRNGDLYIGLRWSKTTGDPWIKLYPHVEMDGGTKYLFDTSTAAVPLTQQSTTNAIADRRTGSTVTVIAPEDGIFVLPTSVFANLTESRPVTHLLFEGCQAGMGQLQILVLKKDGTNYTEFGQRSGAWLDLKEPREFIQRWSSGDADRAAPQSWVRLNGNSGTFAPPKTDEEKDMILYVHGYNMNGGADLAGDKQRWIETIYKRLYWLGYKGRSV